MSPPGGRTHAAWPVWLGPRRCAGVALAALGLYGLAQWRGGAADPRLAGTLTGALAGGLVAAAATALGTLPVVLSQRVSQRASDTMLGFGAGVMLAATAFSLVVPALEAAAAQGHGRWTAGLVVGLGIALGALLLLLADRVAPHVQPVDPARGGQVRSLHRAWVFVAAISLHNLPEGLAIGVAFAGADAAHAQALTTGIALQDVPEGLVVALALRSVGYGRAFSVALGAASGLLEPVAAVLGAAALTVAAGLLPWGLAFAAGAMLYAVSHEAIPGAHQQGNARAATVGLVLGFVLMMVLDTALG